MANQDNSFTLPSDPKDRQAIKDAVIAIKNEMVKMKDMRSYIGDTKKDLKDKFNMPPKIVTKMAKAIMDANYEEVITENSEFELAFENLFHTNQPAPAVDNTSDSE